MSPFKRLISAFEAAGQIMNKWSDEESNAVDMVILPPDNFDALTDEEEVQGDGVIIDNHNEVTFVVHSPPPPSLLPMAPLAHPMSPAPLSHTCDTSNRPHS